MKSAQSGVSERAISEAAWVCDQLGKNVLYTFPAEGQLSDFVAGRINPVITNSEYLQMRVAGQEEEEFTSERKRPDRTGLKRIGEGFLYFRGSQNEKQIISVDADMIVIDERDRFIQANVPYIDKRLLHSDLAWRRYISTPTIPGRMIHQDFMESDQHEWNITCDKCGTQQVLDWWKNVVEDREEPEGCKIICWKCKEKIDRLKEGQWIPKNPDFKIRGYHITGLYNPYLSLKDALKQSKATDIFSTTQFYNQTLGLPYEASGARVTQQDLDACSRDYDIPYRVNDAIVKGCTAGADVGKVIHVMVSKTEPYGDETKARYVWIGTVNNFLGPQDSLEWVMNTFDVETMVVDMMPETRGVQDLVKQFSGRVFGARYPERHFAGKYLEWKLEEGEVQVDRTISLDYYVNEIATQQVIIPKMAESIEGFYDQMKSSVRIIEENTKGVPKAIWQEDSPDHYFHAGNYERIARQRNASISVLIDFYKGGEQVKETEQPTGLSDIQKWISREGTPL